MSDVVIDRTAIVDPGARLGSGVKVGPYAVIGKDVVVGDNVEIAAHACLEGWTEIGRGTRIGYGALIGGAPQDVKYRGERSFCRIGERSIVREYATVHRATGEGNETVVGNGCFLMAYAHVAHNCRIGNEVVIANASQLAGHVLVEDFALVSGLVPVHQFVRIGKLSIIGGGCRVPMDIVPFVCAVGYPIKVRSLNLVGLRRRGYTSEEIGLLKKAFKILFRSELNTTQALDELKDGFPQTENIKYLIQFIESGTRGINK
ncbi:MAG: acyl-ACP--UDP-N-acetylglucosamine O-acyltransferase [bacterium]